MKKIIIVINAGSSSIKFKIFHADDYQVVASGLCERIFVDGKFSMKYGDKQIDLNVAMPNHTAATKCILDQLKALRIIENFNDVVGVGHRVVLAGDKYQGSQVITPEVKAAINDCIKLAPLHNEPELRVIEIFEKLLPNAVAVASFDNTFHATMPPVNYLYPINQQVAKQHAVRRYGMHGNSYRFITQRMSEVLNNKHPNLIICHLGNGASMCAVKDGKSFITTMGLTPLEGLMMGTRCGDIDPSLPIYLIRQGMKVDEVDNMLNKQSGMVGMTGSSDMRDVEAKCKANDQNAIIAFDIYTTRVAEYIIRYTNQLACQVDAIVFTAGIGENSVFVVKNVIERIKVLKLSLDKTALEQKYGDYKKISNHDSQYPIYCVRTDEELMIAKDVKAELK